MNDSYFSCVSRFQPFETNYFKEGNSYINYKFNGNLDKEGNGNGTFTVFKDNYGTTTHSGRIVNGYFDGDSHISHKAGEESFEINCKFEKGALNGTCKLKY